MAETDAGDLHFYFDPVCPFAWMTATWVRTVARQRSYAVQWRFISLRLLNAHVDYDAQFPPEYEAGHTAGLRLLRVCAAARDAHGTAVVGPLYEALGARIWDTPPGPEPLAKQLDTDPAGFLTPILAEAGLPAELAEALDDEHWDAVIRAETDEALSLTGKDVGTPILHVQPPSGSAFFGPVISRQPTDAEAVALWDHVVGLATFGGFAELKRSLRERPQLAALGVASGTVGQQEDWHGGSRRTHR